MKSQKMKSFTVTITGWAKHNAKKKKGHQYIFLSTDFFDDHKIATLNQSEQLLYIYLLLKAGRENSQQVSSVPRVVPHHDTRNPLATLQRLKRLEENQLLTIDKISLLNNNTLQDKTKHHSTLPSKGGSVVPQLTETKPVEPTKELNKEIWEAYSKAYFDRYRVEPTRNATVNAQVSQLAKRLGVDAVEIVKFFVRHPDSFYVSKTHSIGLCLKDAETLKTQWLRKKPITKNMVREYDRNQGQIELSEAIKRGEV